MLIPRNFIDRAYKDVLTKKLKPITIFIDYVNNNSKFKVLNSNKYEESM